MNQKMTKSALALMIAAALLSGCSDNDDDDPVANPDPTPQPEPERVQDTREFAIDPETLPFESLA